MTKLFASKVMGFFLVPSKILIRIVGFSLSKRAHSYWSAKMDLINDNYHFLKETQIPPIKYAYTEVLNLYLNSKERDSDYDFLHYLAAEDKSFIKALSLNSDNLSEAICFLEKHDANLATVEMWEKLAQAVLNHEIVDKKLIGRVFEGYEGAIDSSMPLLKTFPVNLSSMLHARNAQKFLTVQKKLPGVQKQNFKFYGKFLELKTTAYRRSGMLSREKMSSTLESYNAQNTALPITFKQSSWDLYTDGANSWLHKDKVNPKIFELTSKIAMIRVSNFEAPHLTTSILEEYLELLESAPFLNIWESEAILEPSFDLIGLLSDFGLAGEAIRLQKAIQSKLNNTLNTFESIHIQGGVIPESLKAHGIEMEYDFKRSKSKFYQRREEVNALFPLYSFKNEADLRKHTHDWLNKIRLNHKNRRVHGDNRLITLVALRLLELDKIDLAIKTLEIASEILKADKGAENSIFENQFDFYFKSIIHADKITLETKDALLDKLVKDILPTGSIDEWISCSKEVIAIFNLIIEREKMEDSYPKTETTFLNKLNEVVEPLRADGGYATSTVRLMLFEIYKKLVRIYPEVSDQSNYDAIQQLLQTEGELAGLIHLMPEAHRSRSKDLNHLVPSVFDLRVGNITKTAAYQYLEINKDLILDKTKRLGIQNIIREVIYQDFLDNKAQENPKDSKLVPVEISPIINIYIDQIMTSISDSDDKPLNEISKIVYGAANLEEARAKSDLFWVVLGEEHINPNIQTLAFESLILANSISGYISDKFQSLETQKEKEKFVNRYKELKEKYQIYEDHDWAFFFERGDQYESLLEKADFVKSAFYNLDTDDDDDDDDYSYKLEELSNWSEIFRYRSKLFEKHENMETLDASDPDYLRLAILLGNADGRLIDKTQVFSKSFVYDLVKPNIEQWDYGLCVSTDSIEAFMSEMIPGFYLSEPQRKRIILEFSKKSRIFHLQAIAPPYQLKTTDC